MAEPITVLIVTAPLPVPELVMVPALLTGFVEIVMAPVEASLLLSVKLPAKLNPPLKLSPPVEEAR